MDPIDRAQAMTELQMNAKRLTLAYEAHGEGRVEYSDIIIRLSDALDVLRGLPSAQPERKTGQWIERNPQNSDKCRLIECNQCGFSHIVGFNVPYEHWIENRNFCERCGADMRGEQHG